jgi:hypothetical protein
MGRATEFVVVPERRREPAEATWEREKLAMSRDESDGELAGAEEEEAMGWETHATEEGW